MENSSRRGGSRGPVGNNDPVSGKRAAGKASVAIPRRAYLLGAGVIASVVAWAALVWLAISFGGSARSGESNAWGFLALAAVGAVACLFLGLMLGARLLEKLGLITARGPQQPSHPHRH